MTTITMKPKPASKVRSQGSGARGHDGQPWPTLGEELARQMRERAFRVADEHAGELADDEREFLYRIGRGNPPSSADVARFSLLCDRFEHGHHGNGNAAHAAGGNAARAANGNGVPGKRGQESGVRSQEPGARGQGAHAANVEVQAGAIIEIPLSALKRHPVNRQPTKEAIARRAASLRDDGQQEPILVRKLCDGVLGGGIKLHGDVYQVLSGETRWLAARQLGWKTIQARVRECDDNQALEILALANGQREDLTPIDKAKLIEALCAKGHTRDSAAKYVGLNDGASASNLVRLLKLPEPWLSRVASGELEQSWARLLVPVLALEPVMKGLEKDWKARGKSSSYWDSNGFDSRQKLERRIEHLIDQECRRVDAGHQPRNVQYYGLIQLNVAKLTPEERSGLAIVAIERPGAKKGTLETVEVATNVKAFDALIAKEAERRMKAKAVKAGRDKPADKKQLTPAQRKEREKEQAKQLERRIDGWRHDWLKTLVAQKLVDGQPALRERLLIALALGGELRLSGDEAEEDAVIDTARQHAAVTAIGEPYEALLALRDNEEGLYECGTALVRATLLTADRDAKYPHIDHDLMDEWAAFAGVDLGEAWRKLWQHNQPESQEQARLETLFQLFQTAQLDELGDELGNYIRGVNGKAAKVKLLLLSSRAPPLPKCIKPLPGKTVKQKGAKGTKGK